MKITEAELDVSLGRITNHGSKSSVDDKENFGVKKVMIKKFHFAVYFCFVRTPLMHFFFLF